MKSWHFWELTLFKVNNFKKLTFKKVSLFFRSTPIVPSKALAPSEAFHLSIHLDKERKKVYIALPSALALF